MRIKRKYLIFIIFIFIGYFILYKYFFDGFCYNKSSDYLKCASTFICKPDRNVLIDPNLICVKKPVLLYEKEFFLYDKQTYIGIYDNFIDSIKK